jgi:hypothetical protein
MDYWHAYQAGDFHTSRPFVLASLDFFTSIQYFLVCFALFKGNCSAEYVY